MTEPLPGVLPASIRQDTCRRYVENAETWLRKLVHTQLSTKYGSNYISSGPWKQSLIKEVVGRSLASAGTFTREIDATTFEQLIYIVCHPDSWPEMGRGLLQAYPDGVDEARTFLERLRFIRNDISHGRQCSARQLEQAICYSNDIAESIKDYFRSINLAREYNVPAVVLFNDNIGNSERIAPGAFFRSLDLSSSMRRRLYPGDVLVAEVAVDPSFHEGQYLVEWWLKTSPGVRGNGHTARIEITNQHVGERMELQFKVRSTNNWHRDSGGYDDIIDFIYRVLPPAY